jgi:aldose 1-epimerase
MNHTYWNLSGDFTETTVANHALRLKNSRWYLEADADLIPTGSMKSVKNTALDFTDDFTDLKHVLNKNVAGSYFKGLDHAYTIEG